MAKRALGPATQQVVAAVEAVADAPILVACSGGPDSRALAAAAAIVGRRRGLPVRAVTVDHGLQPGSAAVAELVVARLAALGLAATVLAVDVVAAGLGMEAAAREARYAALACEAEPDEERQHRALGPQLAAQADPFTLTMHRLNRIIQRAQKGRA